MKLTIYKTDGKSSGKKVDLNDEIFAVEPNKTLMYEDVRRTLANKRQGTAKTKERGEVRGGGRKAYKQKGTGMARRGSIRSPLLKGGGTIFGPKPHKYTVRMTKKAKRLARKSALSLKASDDAIKIVQDFTFDAPKTKDVLEILKAFELTEKKVILLTNGLDMNVYKSARNLKNIQVLGSSQPSTFQIMNCDILLIQKGAIEELENSFLPKSEEEAA